MPPDARTERLRVIERVLQRLKESKFPLPGLEEARLIRMTLLETLEILAQEIAVG